jgi:hypothetical protein
MKAAPNSVMSRSSSQPKDARSAAAEVKIAVLSSARVGATTPVSR